MHLSHLDASISERTISNGSKHKAQRIFPAARVASTVGRSSSFAEGAWIKSEKVPLGTAFLCCNCAFLCYT